MLVNVWRNKHFYILLMGVQICKNALKRNLSHIYPEMCIHFDPKLPLFLVYPAEIIQCVHKNVYIWMLAKI